MSNQEILKKAIEKAYEGGYVLKDEAHVFHPAFGDYQAALNENSYYRYIFSHDFAKGFFGEGRFKLMCCGFETDLPKSVCPKCKWAHPADKYIMGWKGNLQKMVIKEKPLNYLKKFL